MKKPSVSPYNQPCHIELDRFKVKISEGNTKMGDIASVSTLPHHTCSPKLPCFQDCYYHNLCKLRSPVKEAAKRNTMIALFDPKRYFAAVRGRLAVERPEMFRWHVGGDIINQAYLDEMIAIARDNPRIKFLCFTKRHELDFSQRPANLSILASMWPGWGKVEEARATGLPIAWVQDGTETRIPKSATPCPGKCEKCWKCWGTVKDVVFKKHR